MRSENVKVWIREATREKDPGKKRWEKLVIVTNMALQERCTLTALTWTRMVLIPKFRGEYIWIGLVEVICKVCALIMNNRIRASITLHNVLHGFGQERGTGKATMEEELAQKIAGLVMMYKYPTST